MEPVRQSAGELSVMKSGKGIWLPLIVGAILLTQGCMGGFYSMENRILDNYFAIYTIESEDYPDEDLRTYMAEQTAFPEMNAGDIMQLLGGLRFRRESLWGTDVRPVFYPREISRFAPQLARTMRTSGQNERILLISRFDPDESVLSRMERTTLILWQDANGLNLVFGEIKEPIPHDDFLVDDNWTEVLPVSFRKAYPDLELVSTDAFEYKRVGDYDHQTWAVMAPATMQSILDQDEAPGFDTEDSYFSASDDDEPRGSGPQESEATLTEKLRQLEKARKEGLISEEEYGDKRAEILRDF